MTSIKKANYPAISLLGDVTQYNFVDSFSAPLSSKKKIDSSTAGQAFFAGSPSWVATLFKFRNE